MISRPSTHLLQCGGQGLGDSEQGGVRVEHSSKSDVGCSVRKLVLLARLGLPSQSSTEQTQKNRDEHNNELPRPPAAPASSPS
jgi:hypothetical protein